MRIIIAQWSDGRVTAYSSVTVFLSHHPGRNYDTIMSYISRKNEPYVDSELKLFRIDVTRAVAAKKKKASTEL
ncbi:MAG TPA: hypothetical protein VL443_30125 [Cyclobacteriaceae bacterium]|jgi:hypothetical protein|nr:hypothetical protein [Cyclobacteriaceae bacterium]